VKAAFATGALAIVTIPLAGAIGRSSPSRALLATVAAATAGGLVYIGVLALTRSEELRSLLDLVRRRGAMPVDVSP